MVSAEDFTLSSLYSACIFLSSLALLVHMSLDQSLMISCIDCITIFTNIVFVLLLR